VKTILTGPDKEGTVEIFKGADTSAHTAGEPPR
jgi:hypothetical protein